MIRALLYVSAIVATAVGLSWLADQPGELNITLKDYEIHTSLFRAIVIVGLLAMAAIMVWSVLRQIMSGPTNVGQFFRRRKQEKGLEALSAGIIAVGSGDRALASQYAKLAHRSMPNEPLTHLLRAQAAQLSGDRATARRIYESMRHNPETELLGLRGLYLEAQQEKEPEAARQYAERAVALNPQLGWSVESLFAMQCKDGDWQGALETLAKARKNGQIEKAVGDRRRAVLLTAQAVEAEESDAARALTLAVEAHGLAPSLVPAAAVAGRLLASQGATPRAARILQRTWRQGPHPDLATAYAFARIGDSPRDRLTRIRELAQLTPHNDEGQIAVAVAAIDAQDWEAARRALQHLVDAKPTQRICTLMARIEGGQHGDTGKVREWLARAVHAPRDPAWVADGHVANRWAPISPVTGALDAFEWQQPAGILERSDSDLLIEQLVPSLPPEPVAVNRAKAIEAEEVASPATAASPGGEHEPQASPAQRQSTAKSTASPDGVQRRPAYPSATASVSAGATLEDVTAASSRLPAPLRTSQAHLPLPAATDGKTGPQTFQTSQTSTTPITGQAGKSVTVANSPVTRMQPGGLDKSRDKPAGAVDALQSLRAPDDPGPDVSESDDGRTPMTRFRVPPVKGPL